MKKAGRGWPVMLTRFPKTILVLSERSGMGRRGPLPEFFVGSFFGRGFASGLAFEAGERVFEHFGDAAGTGFRCAAKEDAWQTVAALGRSHGLPAFVGAGVSGGGAVQNMGEIQ